MLLLADSREIAARLCGAERDVRPLGPGDGARLPRFLRDALLAGRNPVAAAELPLPGWSLAIAVEDAPRSQFDALSAVPGGAEALPHRLLAVAGTGRGFHGQRGRPWVALRGNLHLVAFSRVDLPAAASVGPLAALPAVAVTEAIDALPGFAGRAAIKWVNDVLLDGRKVAGVLTRTWSRGNRVTGVLLGIGLDVETVPGLPDDPLARGATSLAAAVPPGVAAPGLAAAFSAIARTLAAGLDALAAGRGAELVARYRARASFLGRTVEIVPDPLLPGETAKPPIRGRARALGDQMELWIEGHDRPVTRGRLRVLD